MSGWVIVADEPAAQRDSLVGDHRCAACGYGVAVAGALPECPMCGGLVPCPGSLAQSTTTNDLWVEFVAVVTDGTRLSPAAETATYRIVQGAITNAVKHANARTISVSLIEHETTWYH